MQEKLVLPPDYNFSMNLSVMLKNILAVKNTKIIFFAPDEVDTWQSIKQYQDRIEELCAKTNNFIEVWEGNYLNYTLDSNYIKVINWQTMCATLVLGLYDFENQHTLAYNTFLVSLNRSAIRHKCEFIDLLAKYDLIKGNIVSWHKQNFKHYNFKYFNNEILHIDNINTPTSCLSYSKEYNKGFLDLVCESYDDFPDISEKTFKAIAAKKLFVSVGYKGFYKQLETLGFELYTEVFDYSFDNEKDFSKRAESVVKQVKKYENSDYETLYQSVCHKIEHNYNNFLKVAYNVPNEFIDFIHKYDVEYYTKLFDHFKKNNRQDSIFAI